MYLKSRCPQMLVTSHPQNHFGGSAFVLISFGSVGSTEEIIDKGSELPKVPEQASGSTGARIHLKL